MTSPRRLADHIRRTAEGPMWHGPSLSELLAGVPAEQARVRPLEGRHSIRELVDHMAVWAEIARERLSGDSLDYPQSERDWPTAEDETAEGWRRAVERLVTAYRELSIATATLSREALALPVEGQDHFVSDMLHGVIEHGCYHGGQVAILRESVKNADMVISPGTPA